MLLPDNGQVADKCQTSQPGFAAAARLGLEAAAAQCPIRRNRDDRKSAAIAAANVRTEPGSERIGDFAFARDILRSGDVLQAGAGAESVPTDNPEHVPVFFLDGEPHRARRAKIARFFTPKAIAERHRLVMERATDELLTALRREGQARLDDISFRLAAVVAADIVGLTESDTNGLMKRLRKTLDRAIQNRATSRPARALRGIATLWHTGRLFLFDVRPAIKARRKVKREDVISHLVDEGYSGRSILIECLTYGTAGMVTTREFIVMVAWHLFDDADLKERFLAASEVGQLAILEEILRLEPVAALLYRRAVQDATASGGKAIAGGALYAIDMRAANVDPAVTGECPFALDPDRAKWMKAVGSYMSFGDGPHRCPGAQVALQETRVFVDRLMRLPGIRLAQKPTMTWLDALGSYELRDAVVTCDRG